MSESDCVPNGFRVIPGLPRYAVNESGTSVLSVCAIGHADLKSRPWTKSTRLSFVKSKGGYHNVNIQHDGRNRLVGVHALVLMAFVGPCHDGMQCRHLDGNPTNNHVSNLAWGTRSENERDKILHGTDNRGEKNCGAKLTVADVLAIRARAANGELQSVIAKDFCVKQPAICRIVLRKTWTHV